MDNSLQLNLSPIGDSSKAGESQVGQNLNVEQNQQASFSGRPTSPTELEPPVSTDLSHSHDESTVGQKLIPDFDVSTIATDSSPFTGSDLENPSQSDDTPRTITPREEKAMCDSLGKESASLDDFFVNRVLNRFEDPFQALCDYQIKESSESDCDRHGEDSEKVFMHELGAYDYPFQPDSLHTPETITAFLKTIREKTTESSTDKPIRQSSSSGTVVAHRKRKKPSSIEASSVLQKKKARRETMTSVEFSSAPQVTRKGLSGVSDSDSLAPHVVEETSGNLLTVMPRVTPKYLDLGKQQIKFELALCKSQIDICHLIQSNVQPTSTIPGCGFFHPPRFLDVMFSLCKSSYKNAFPKTIIGIGSGRGFLEKCFELMGGLNVKCYDRQPCNEFIPVESAEFPKDIVRILPDDCSGSVLVAGYPQGYLGPVLSEFIRRGGEMLCTTVERSLFSDMHEEYEDDPDILRKAISELRKMNGEFFQVKLNLSHDHPFFGLLPSTYIQFYNWPSNVKQAIFECPELSGFCSDIGFSALSYGLAQARFKRSRSHDETA